MAPMARRLVRRAFKALPEAATTHLRAWGLGHRGPLAGTALLTANYTLVSRPRQLQFSLPDGGEVDGRSDDLVLRYLHVFGVWEPELTSLLAAHLRPGDTFVDVGANIGYYSSLALAKVGAAGRVVAIEPLPQLAAKLRRWPGLDVVECAAAAEQGDARLSLPPSYNRSIASLMRSDGDSITVQTRSLDAVLADLAVDARNVTAVKIDVERAEALVARGARDTLHAMPAGSLVLMEIANHHNGEQIVDLMREAGFRGRRVANFYDPWWYCRVRDGHRRQPRSGFPADVAFRKVG